MVQSGRAVGRAVYRQGRPAVAWDGSGMLRLLEKEATMIELTPEQQQALQDQTQGPLHVLNPRTQKMYVLIPKDVYELTSRIISGPNRRGWDNPEDDDLIRDQA